MTELLDYYRTKEVSSAPFLLHHLDDFPFNLDEAREVKDGRFTIQGVTAKQRRHANGSIDWEYRGPRRDKEWAWLANRHHYFYHLVTAYKETDDPSFINALDLYLRDWILQNPSPRRLNFTPGWRALEAARRILDSWVWTFYCLQETSAFSAEARLLLLSSLPDHGDMLANHPSFWGGNHLLTEKIALAQLAVAFPEFHRSDEWLRVARSTVRQTLFAETYPDGGYKELAFHYHRIVSENMLLLLRLLEFGGVGEEDPELRERVLKMWEYLVMVARPNGFGPLNNDSDLDSIRFPRYLKLLGEKAPSDWVYLISGRTEGRAPQVAPSRFFPWSGHAVFRQNWREQAHWAFFDAGPYGIAHQQMDRLHLSVAAHGEDYLVDSGRYTYHPGPFREYFRGAPAHNVVLLDGEGTVSGPRAVSRPLPVTWTQTPRYSLAAAMNPYDGNAGRHHRTVFYRQNRFFLVVDEVVSFGPRTIEALWHLHPDRTVEDIGEGHLIRGERGSLWLHPLREGQWEDSSRRGQESPVPRGWYSAHFNVRHPSTELVFRHRSRGPRTFAWLIVPMPGKPRGLPEVEVRELRDGRVDVEIGFPDGSRDRIALHRGEVEAFESSGR